jgi:hypothetical protein
VKILLHWLVTVAPYPLVWWGASGIWWPLGPLAAGLLWWLDLQIETIVGRRA